MNDYIVLLMILHFITLITKQHEISAIDDFYLPDAQLSLTLDHVEQVLTGMTMVGDMLQKYEIRVNNWLEAIPDTKVIPHEIIVTNPRDSMRPVSCNF